MHGLRGVARSGRRRRMIDDRRSRLLCDPTLDLDRGHDALRFEYLLVAVEPLFVVARRQIQPMRHVLDGRALLRRGVDAMDLARDGDAVHAPLPRGVERRLSGLRDDRTQTVLAADIV